MPADPPEVVVRGVLRQDWNSANTANVLPDIHHGWLNEESGEPEVTISNPEESPVGGGDTGYSGIATDGEPTQELGGTVMVNCWADRDRHSENPRKLAYLFKDEVARILLAHYNAPTAPSLDYLAYQGAQRFVDEDSDPVVYRYQVAAGYGYGRGR